MRNILTILVTLPIVAACASASGQVKTGQRPDLVVPPPPAHVVPITAEPVIEPVADVPASPSATAPAGRGALRPVPKPPASESRPEAKPVEAKPEAPAPETPPPAPPAAPAAPAPQLRTAESSGAEGAVRGAIERTRNILLSIDYRYLSTTRKKAYDDAKGFAQQAEDALKAGNVVFAQSVANKAEALAKELAGK